MVRIVEAEYEINKDELFQRLKIKESSSIFKTAEKSFEKLMKIITENMKLTNIYMLKEKTFEFNFDELDNCKEHVYCFSSGGHEIVRIIGELIDKNEYLDAYMLNDMVNDIVFSASTFMNKKIKNDLSCKGLNLGKKFYPGEHGLDMRHQKNILDLLKENIDIDAELTDSYMIKPEKSMLYVFSVGVGIESCSVEHDCDLCELKECMYKKTKGLICR